MIASVDGRIVTSGWNLSPEGRQEYERTAATYGANAWMCGRVTMAAFAKGTAADVPTASSHLPKKDFLAPHQGSSYAIALDPHGKLFWHTNAIDGDHIITVLTERVAPEYLAFLQAQGVSYLFAGTDSLDLPTALDKLASTFHIKTLLLEGGGKINGTLLHAGLIDELSLLVAPLADGTNGTPTLFDTLNTVSPSQTAKRLTLLGVEQRTDGILWVRYRCS
jgi:riboflavin biosynthesis pyrimidine reductase